MKILKLKYCKIILMMNKLIKLNLNLYNNTHHNLIFNIMKIIKNKNCNVINVIKFIHHLSVYIIINKHVVKFKNYVN